MKFKFIVKPPPKKEYQKEFLEFKKKFEAEQDFTEKNFSKNAQNLAKEAFQAGFERIVFVAGDGLLNEGINGIMEAARGKIPANFAVGVVPAGTGNDFSKALGISKDVKKAFEIIKKGEIIPVDMGKANERFFINCFSFGFDAQVNDTANKIKENCKFLPKQGGYLLAALKEVVFNFNFFEVAIEGKGVNLKEKILLAAATNTSSYGGMFKINPGASIQDGLLNLCYIRTMGKIKALISIYRVFKGAHINLPEVKMFKMSSLKVSSSELLPWEVDGEVQKPEREFRLQVFPGAINFLTP